MQEIACSSMTGGDITSGGGFSDLYYTPSYQVTKINKKYMRLFVFLFFILSYVYVMFFYICYEFQLDTIQNYLNKLNSSLDSPIPGYNNNGRGYPDIAALGNSYPVVVGGQFMAVSAIYIERTAMFFNNLISC